MIQGWGPNTGLIAITQDGSVWVLAKHDERPSRVPGITQAVTILGRRDLDLKFVVAEAQKGNCYIATAVYGSYEAPEVRVLRGFRDRVLAANAIGRLAIRGYYATSPAVVRAVGHRSWFTAIVRPILDRVVARIKAHDPIDGSDEE